MARRFSPFVILPCLLLVFLFTVHWHGRSFYYGRSKVEESPQKNQPEEEKKEGELRNDEEQKRAEEEERKQEEKRKEEEKKQQEKEAKEEEERKRIENIKHSSKRIPGEENMIFMTYGTQGTPLNDDISFDKCSVLEPWMKCKYLAEHPDALEKSHAVVFAASEINSLSDFPSEKPQRQKWVFYDYEMPYKWTGQQKDMEVWKFFDFISTPLLDADMPYSPLHYSCWPVVDWNSTGKDHTQGKEGKVLVITDKCQTNSKREQYLDELRKYIHVDVAGKCGHLAACSDPKDKICIEELLSKYKFYLAFEDELCDGYYNSEDTLWSVMDINIVPIVLGKTNYSTGFVNLLPPGSYLDVRNFHSPRRLADHLHRLDSNHTAYNLMVETKMHAKYEKIDVDPFHCKLCRYLHLHKRHTQNVDDVRSVWNTKKCVEPKEFYKGIADEILQKL